MSISPDDLQEVAKSLANGEFERDWRSSVSRSYYAAFHYAKLHTHFCPSNDHLDISSHTRVSDSFMGCGNNKGKAIAYVLVSMKRFRVTADYEISDEFQQSTAINQVAQFNTLKQKIDDFAQNNGK